jgi:hypothetical protein
LKEHHYCFIVLRIEEASTFSRCPHTYYHTNDEKGDNLVLRESEFGHAKKESTPAKQIAIAPQQAARQ